MRDLVRARNGARDFAFARQAVALTDAGYQRAGLIARLHAARLYLRQSGCNETEGGELLVLRSVPSSPVPLRFHRSRRRAASVSRRG